MTKIIEQWNTKTVGGTGRLDTDNFELISDNINLQETNYDALKLVDLIGRITNNRSSSGPIPDTQISVETQVASSAGYTTVFTPDQGEVWQFIAGCCNTTTNPTTSVTTELDIYDTVNDRRILFVDIASSSSSDYPLVETNFPPIYISYPFVLRQRVEGSFDLATRTYTLIRVR